MSVQFRMARKMVRWMGEGLIPTYAEGFPITLCKHIICKHTITKLLC